MAVQPWGEQEFGAARPPASGPPAMPYPAMPHTGVPQVAMPQSAMRAATADRERTVDVLKAAFAEGRLSAAEYGERFEAASTAQTYGQLARLVADLPSGPMVAPQMTVAQAGPVLLPVPPTFLAPPPPRRTNAVAVTSLVLGLLCVPTGGLLGVPAVITGHIGRRQAAERNEEGDGMAVTGIVFGWLSIAFWAMIMLMVGVYG
ncbi:DUF1707 and DUF4190 domain-containing protein [Kitasatospora purpeofusca]|uniref:DUF1707 and DUF4190 domain-containing protein n=1 Tax=Kitasatospora purpeofusca TaxID=67352 RepID=UPI002A5A06B2|nr:DUF1707 and DUF4190 domain-containing protein [Kitasatospora purpeofusca]MDY0815398.1 DUF1707 and DUF4190 domain-containing protein [Kitasatospora purpeofusca]